MGVRGDSGAGVRKLSPSLFCQRKKGLAAETEAVVTEGSRRKFFEILRRFGKSGSRIFWGSLNRQPSTLCGIRWLAVCPLDPRQVPWLQFI